METLPIEMLYGLTSHSNGSQKSSCIQARSFQVEALERRFSCVLASTMAQALGLFQRALPTRLIAAYTK